MITVSDYVEDLVRKSPFISEGLQQGLINTSAYARMIIPEISAKVGREVKLTTVVMAINRMDMGNLTYERKKLSEFFKKIKDILVRGHLTVYTFRQSNTFMNCLAAMLKQMRDRPDVMCTFSQGVAECTIIISASEEEVLEQLFTTEIRLDKEINLSAFTMLLPAENRVLSGVYYHILRQLAWQGINVVEVVSTSNEFTIVVEEKWSGITFEVLRLLGKN